MARVKSKKVKKALSPEEQMLVSNCLSILDELQQMGSGGATEEPMIEEEPVMEAEDSMTEEEAVEETVDEKEVKMILKALEQTESDGATASDDAEDRIEGPLPELTEENVMEVEKAKQILQILKSVGNKPKQVQKSTDPSLQILNKVAEVVKKNNEQVSGLSEAFGHVLKGLGLSKQLEIAKAEQDRKQEASKGNAAQNAELVNVLKSFVEATKAPSPSPQVNKSETSSSASNHVQARKNISDRNVMKGLLG